MLTWILTPLGYCLASFIFVLILASALLIIYARWNYGQLEAAGFTVIKPHFFLGSDPYSYKKYIQEQDVEWVKKYGPVFGIYEGRMPQVCITDPELIRLIFVKDVEFFYDRREFKFGVNLLDDILDFMPGEKWKTVRTAMTPMFTSSRIKVLGHVAGELADEYIGDLHDQFKDGTTMTNGAIKMNVREFMIPILVEMTSKCFLGVSVQDRKNPNNDMIRLLRKAAFEDMTADVTTPLFQSFPFMMKFLMRFMPDFEELPKVSQMLEHLIVTRTQQKMDSPGQKHNDFVEILETTMAKVESPEFKRLNITRDTVLAMGWFLFIAGYDTMGLLLNMCAYQFAKNPECQERAIAEVDRLYKNLEANDKSVDADALTELPYLSACIQEVLRLHPAFPRPERMCNKDWSYEGIHIKKGMNVVILGWAANRNPEIYNEPESFLPERWLGENKDALNQFAFTSFGFGHRNCIGQRMGIFITKLIMCRFLKEFKFQDREDTIAKIKIGSSMLVRYEPFFVDVVKR